MEDWISRRWEKRVGSFIRFYEVHLRPDLWGNWTVVQVWGRRNSALGRVITVPVTDYAAGLQLLQQISVRRQQRGYEAIPSG